MSVEAGPAKRSRPSSSSLGNSVLSIGSSVLSIIKAQPPAQAPTAIPQPIIDLLPPVNPLLSSVRVTEMCGEAGTGKTNMSLSLCLHALLCSPTASTIYLTCGIEAGGSAFSTIPAAIQRFGKMATEYTNRNGGDLNDLLKRFHHLAISTTDDFQQLFLSPPTSPASINSRVADKNPSLLIIDSLAGLYRASYSDLPQPPPHFFFQLTQSLHRLPFHTVMINQVKNALGGGFVPCFGLTWSCAVNARVFLRRYEGKGGKWLRKFRIEFGGKGEGEYKIEEWGVCAIEP